MICVYKQMELLEQPNSKLLTNLGITGIAKLIRRGCSYNIGHKVHHWKFNFLVAFLHLSVWTAPDPALSNWLEHGQAMVSYTFDHESLKNWLTFPLNLAWFWNLIHPHISVMWAMALKALCILPAFGEKRKPKSLGYIGCALSFFQPHVWCQISSSWLIKHTLFANPTNTTEEYCSDHFKLQVGLWMYVGVKVL